MSSLKVEGSIPFSTDWKLFGIVPPDKTPFNFGQPDHDGTRERISFVANKEGTRFKVMKASITDVVRFNGTKDKEGSMEEIKSLRPGIPFFLAHDYIDENNPLRDYPQVIRVTQIIDDASVRKDSE